jgi:hypothetical protein
MKIDTLVATPMSMIRQMTKEETMAFMGLFQMKSEVGPVKKIREFFGKDADIFTIDVFLRRLEAATPEMEYCAQTILMMAQLAPNVASIVMWAYTLVQETRINGVVDMEVFADLFPNGFPTEEGYSQLWAEQKNYNGARDNWLDVKEAWS